MKIQHLTIEGFGPFAACQEIDFAALDEAGVFLITGRTGSGKSSILDAICFALYGSAPRYDGVQARLRSDHVAVGAPTRVTLEFTVAGERWRVSRSPEYERPKQRGAGTTIQEQVATLEQLQGTEWVGIAARPRDVAEHLAPVLQLTVEQFLQVILLAQGRFQEFLRAKSEDRIGLLRALFGTDRFARFEAEVTERARALELAVGTQVASMQGDLRRLAEVAAEELPVNADAAWAEGVAVRLAAEAASADDAATMAQALFEAADRAASEAAAIEARQRRRSAALATLARIEATRPEVDAARGRVADAIRVLPVLPAADAVDSAARALPALRRAVADAEAACGGPVDSPARVIAELDELLGTLAGPLQDERDLPRLRAAVDQAVAARTAVGDRVTALVAEAEGLPARQAVLREARAIADAAATGIPAAEGALDHARAVAAAAATAERCDAVVRDADAALLRTLAEEEAAVAHRRALITARLAGAAGLLATHLVPGDPCPVCGAEEHPAPAQGDGSTPDDGAIADAETRQQRAADRRAAAGTAAARAREQLHDARIASGGVTAAAAASGITAAETALAAARAGSVDLARLDRELEALVTRAADLQTALEAARDAETRSAEALATAVGARDAASARISAALGDAASVAERAVAVAGRRTSIEAVESARRRVATAEADLEAARLRLADALSAAAVPDSTTARGMALLPADRDDLERRVREWDAARSGAATQLADPEVAAAPQQPANVDGTTAAKTAALHARVEAGDRRAEAIGRASAAHALAAAIRTVDLAVAEDRAQLAVLAPLAEVVRGSGANEKRMRLESYVLAARLEQIVAAANQRLAAMTDGRFTLQHDDSIGYRGVRSGLGLVVLDEHTGRPRPVASLSGGETFLASLALALGLAEVVSAEAGGVRLDTLFVDEGFGSLDGETLDTAMETLDSLRAGGRTVGLISHVEAMQEDIPSGLHVERLPDGSSAVRARALV